MDEDPGSDMVDATQNEADALQQDGNAEYPRRLSARDGFVLLISIQVGSGIFTSPSQVDGNVASPAAALLSWGIAGMLAWAGATAFAELGATLPHTGGMQEYLRYVYGDIVAFSMAWIWILVVKPTAMAILSILLVESISLGISGTTTQATETNREIFASFAFLIVALINCSNTKPSSKIGEAFVAFKFGTVGLIVLGSLSIFLIHIFDPSSSLVNPDWYTKSWLHARPGTIDWPTVSWWTLLGHFSAAVHAAFWAYSGWDNANFIAGEMINPNRNLPHAIHSAMGTVILCFLFTNISYYILLPWAAVSLTDAIAVTAAKSLLGASGTFLVAILVALSCAGALNGNIFVSGRLTMAAAQKGYLPRFLGKHWSLMKSHSTRRRNETDGTVFQRLPLLSWLRPSQATRNNQEWTPLSVEEPIPEELQLHAENGAEEGDGTQQGAPINAILLSTCLTVSYIFLGSFRVLLTFIGIAEYSFFFLTVLGLIILRSREPTLPRPYKTSIVIHIAFCSVTALVVMRTVIFVPFQGLALLLLLVVGIGLRLWTRHKCRRLV
ncbi:amino acid/polyamine transporter I [Hyaloscypha finlandica]|nr:amino acid/polyamine transporter I [Hyaloscypha finlandica]